MTDLKKMENPNFRIPKCLHHDCGYCKFGEKCRKRHLKTSVSSQNVIGAVKESTQISVNLRQSVDF